MRLQVDVQMFKENIPQVSLAVYFAISTKLSSGKSNGRWEVFLTPPPLVVQIMIIFVNTLAT